MLTKHVARPSQLKRTSHRQITEESLALRELRISHGLSMRQLGKLIGKSDSYISHIETGRLDFPKSEALDHLLKAFGAMKPKSFFERARRCRRRMYEVEFIMKWLTHTSDENVTAIFELIGAH